jgi:hypothetical protein
MNAKATYLIKTGSTRSVQLPIFWELLRTGELAGNKGSSVVFQTGHRVVVVNEADRCTGKWW